VARRPRDPSARSAHDRDPRHAVRTKALAAACAADRRCNARFPKVEHALTSNLRAAERRPTTVRGRHEGATIPIALDGGTTLRAFREGLAWVPEGSPAAIAANTLRDSTFRYDWISDGPLFTLGYGVDPGREDVFSHGAWFSTICHDQLPFVRQADLDALTRGSPAYREVFARSRQVERAGVDRRRPFRPVRLAAVRAAGRSHAAPQLDRRDPRRGLQRPRRQLLRARDEERLGRPADLAAEHDLCPTPAAHHVPARLIEATFVAWENVDQGAHRPGLRDFRPGPDAAAAGAS
jgi:hypothetical protein